MKLSPLTVAGPVLVGGLLAVVTAAPALAVCDAYSGACPSAAPTQPSQPTQPETGGAAGAAGGTTPVSEPAAQPVSRPVSRPAAQPAANVAPVRSQQRTQASTPAELPFTGGEVVLLGTVGVGALAAGTALVIAGRRRPAPTA